MPREQINYSKPYELAEGTTALSDTGGEAVPDEDSPIPGEVIQRNAPTLHVSWLKDCMVQLALEGDVTYFRFAADTPDGSTSDRSTVYTVPLTRDEVNKLIRTLRRARDQVFGRDE